MKDATPTPPVAPGVLTGRHVLMALLGFFGVIFLVNGYFLRAALSTYSGIVAVEPYRKGLQYNQRIADDARQGALGWIDAIDVAADGTLSVTLRRADGTAVSDQAISGGIGRPSTGDHDQAFRLREVEPGRYAAGVGKLAGGTWVVTIEARGAEGDQEPVYRARRRLWLKP